MLHTLLLRFNVVAPCVRAGYESAVRSVAVVRIAIAMTMMSACGSSSRRAPDPDIAARNPDEACSELASVAYDWAGRPTVCGPGSVVRDLMPLGDGLVLDWRPNELAQRIWAAGTTQPLGASYINDGSSGVRDRTLVFPVGKRRVLLVLPDKTNVSLFTVNVQGPAGSDLFQSGLGESVFDDAFTGRSIVALDDDFFLDYRTGSGTYLVRRIDEAARGTLGVIVTTEFHGLKEGLRRGSRLVNLGQHRLLEWEPATHHYRVWPYRFEAGRADIFDPLPVAEGEFLDLTASHELRVIADDRILVWDRSSGRVQLHVLDPLAANPLGGALLGDQVYPRLTSPQWESPPTSKIKNLVVVLQRGRSFDSYFGRYCEAPAGSAPTCEDGPGCCERMPDAIPGASACTPLDATVDAPVPKADFACLTAKIHGGDMTGFGVPPCGAPTDFACVPPGDAAGAFGFYHRAAAAGSLADRYFQSTVDGDEQNLIYLAKTAYGTSVPLEFGFQITRVMAEKGVRWSVYLDDAMATRGLPTPIFFDRLWDFFRAANEIDRDIELETLPAISIVIAAPGQAEQPGAGPASAGVQLVEDIAARIAASPRYAGTTLVLATHLTSGGFYDHVAPPPAAPLMLDVRQNAPVDYGPRVPLLALGRFARVNHVSHVPLELSSITRFMEWNWLAGQTGQLRHRDVAVSNLGSLLDAAATGTPVP
jgi:hypothetical protein